ncbi:MAG: hypothetical protein ACWA5K_06865 [bacterium]
MTVTYVMTALIGLVGTLIAIDDLKDAKSAPTEEQVEKRGS